MIGSEDERVNQDVGTPRPWPSHKPLIESMRHGHADWGTCRSCGVPCEFVRTGVTEGYDGYDIEGYWRHPRASLRDKETAK